MFFGIDFNELFFSSINPLEMIVRGTAVYLALYFLLRLLLKRESSEVGVTNLLVIVLLADAAQNAMAGGYESITDGLILVTTIIAWSWALDWLSWRSELFNRLIRPEKLLLVNDGRLLRRNMKKELITEEEIMIEVRAHGFESLSQVRRVYIEPNGIISVIGHERGNAGDKPKRR